MSQQSFHAGQAKGETHEKAAQWTESAQQTAHSAREKTADAAHSAREKTADAAHSAREKTADAAQSTKESAQHGQEQAAGFLSQTGESVKNMAQGAVDTVKNTLGINDKK